MESITYIVDAGASSHRSLKAAKRAAQRIANKTGRSVEIATMGGRVLHHHTAEPSTTARKPAKSRKRESRGFSIF